MILDKDLISSLNILRNKSVLITGASGLFGKGVFFLLNELNMKFMLNLRFILSSRDSSILKKIYQDKDNCIFINNDYLTEVKNVDYIIHCAAPTDSNFLGHQPVEVIEDIVFFTSNLLKKAKLWGATFIYISSIEAYGESRSNKLLNEKEIGYLSLTNPRNAYPESKRICELLCYSYYKEYGLHTNIIRPTQTFGRFVSKSDGRVFAYIARSILSNKDVILSSDGLSSKPYISTDDLAFAIIYVILKGKVGECYNVANKDNFCSINDLFMFAKEAFNNQKVKLIHRNEKLDIYPKNTYINLDTLKLSNLGWEPKDNLINMFKQLKLYWDSIS